MARRRNTRGQFVKGGSRRRRRKSTTRRAPARRATARRTRSNPVPRRRRRSKSDVRKIVDNITKAAAVTGGVISAGWLVNFLTENYFPQLARPFVKAAALAAVGLVIARFGGRFLGRATANSLALGAAVLAVIVVADRFLPVAFRPSDMAGCAPMGWGGMGETYSNQQALPHQMGETYSNQQALPHQMAYGGHMGRAPIATSGPFTGGFEVPGTVTKRRY